MECFSGEGWVGEGDDPGERVLVACPGPLPVLFSVSYRENGRAGTSQLPGFPDLGQVPYTGCKSS